MQCTSTAHSLRSWDTSSVTCTPAPRRPPEGIPESSSPPAYSHRSSATMQPAYRAVEEPDNGAGSATMQPAYRAVEEPDNGAGSATMQPAYRAVEEPDNGAGSATIQPAIGLWRSRRQAAKP